MKAFAAAWRAVVEAPRREEAEEALVGYLRAAPPADAAWAVWFLAGKRLRPVPAVQLRAWALAASGLPEWLFERSHDAVGHLAETVAHLLGGGRAASDWPLHRLVAERLVPAARAGADERRRLVVATWSELGADELDLWNRLLSGALRPRPEPGLLARAVAAAIGGAPRQVEAWLAEAWVPEPGALERLAAAPAPPSRGAALFGAGRAPGGGGGGDAGGAAGAAGRAAATPGGPAAAGVGAPAVAPPCTFEAVLLYAQRSDGGRGNLYTDLTLGAWDDGSLVPVARVAGGLAAAEALELDRWIRRNAVDRFGPVRHVRPEQVFEIGCDGLSASGRHKAGLVPRGARLLRWRRDRVAGDAATLGALRDLVDR